MTQLLEMPQVETPEIGFDFDELLRFTRPVKPKLSEAIRAGSRLTRHTRYVWLAGSRETGYATCALGAACYSLNEFEFEHSVTKVTKGIT
jgi:hypothetical protein